jgi:hypothetical protein
VLGSASNGVWQRTGPKVGGASTMKLAPEQNKWKQIRYTGRLIF